MVGVNVGTGLEYHVSGDSKTLIDNLLLKSVQSIRLVHSARFTSDVKHYWIFGKALSFCKYSE